MLRALVAVSLAALAAATAASPAGPRVLTQRDSGRTIVLRLHVSATLRLSHDWRWNEPHVAGAAVELTPVEYFRDPGFSEWTVEAVARGRAVVTAAGRPAKRFRLVVRVV